MKTPLLLFVLIFLITCSCYGQKKTILKTWITKNLDYLKIDNENAYFEMYGHYMYEKQYTISGDTLRLYSTYTSSRDNFAIEHTDNFDFRIKELTGNSLVLVPLNLNAETIANGKYELNYVDKNTMLNNNLAFSEIRYRIYGGAWEWLDISFSIDSNRAFKYINNSKNNNPEYFAGTLSKDQFAKFIKVLKSSEIDKLYGFEQIVFDAPKSMLEVEYNGKLQSIKQDILPSITSDLTNLIRKLQTETPLLKTLPFKIDFGKN